MAIVLAGEAPLWDGRGAGVRGRVADEKAVKAEELVGRCTGNRGLDSRFWLGAGVGGVVEKAEKGLEGGEEGDGKEEKTLDL